MIEMPHELRVRSRHRRRGRSTDQVEEPRRFSLGMSGTTDRADMHAAIERPLSPGLDAVAVSFGRRVGS